MRLNISYVLIPQKMKKDLLDFFANKKKEEVLNELNAQKIDSFKQPKNIDDVEFQELTFQTIKCAETCTLCNLHLTMRNSWDKILAKEFNSPYFRNLITYLHTVPFFPPLKDIFRFTFYFSIDKTKVIILGQDPYHNNGQAMGLSFSVPRHIKIPPSLRNIYKELQDDIRAFQMPAHGDLTSWAEQGVLLLNDILTVEKNKPGSHSKIGWRTFTHSILEHINKACNNVVFMLWGNYARSKAKLIDANRHLILEAPHPSPFSATKFFKCRHFSKTNDYLIKHNKEPINWSL